MALISCPECKHQVSDRATSCPNCGYPISSNRDAQIKKISDNEVYCIIFKRLCEPNKIEVIKAVRHILNISLPEAKCMVDNPPSVLKKGISFKEAIEIKDQFDSVGAVTEIEQYTLSQDDLENIAKEKQILDKHKDDTVRCPRCGSSAVTTGQRGFSFWTGFLGSNKTVNRCAKCGYSWEPK